jgi:hypothetical protein
VVIADNELSEASIEVKAFNARLFGKDLIEQKDEIQKVDNIFIPQHK